MDLALNNLKGWYAIKPKLANKQNFMGFLMPKPSL